MRAILICVCMCVAGCGGSTKKTATEVGSVGLHCAEAEAQSVASKVSVLDVAHAVDAAIAFAKTQGFAATEHAIEALILQYGEPIVACAVLSGLAPADQALASGAPTATAAAAPIAEDPTSDEAVRRQLAIAHQWSEAP